MAPPPLSDLLDWRVPYVPVLAMICVSLVYDSDALLDGLRAPPLTGVFSPAAIASGASGFMVRSMPSPPPRPVVTAVITARTALQRLADRIVPAHVALFDKSIG